MITKASHRDEKCWSSMLVSVCRNDSHNPAVDHRQILPERRKLNKKECSLRLQVNKLSTHREVLVFKQIGILRI